MEKVIIDLQDRSYNILIESGLLRKASEELSKFVKNKKCLIISDDNVFKLYGDITFENLKKSLAAEIYKFVFKPGEESKNISVLAAIYNFMAEKSLSRDSIIIALGGGVTGDIAGFAAATYMRGIDFIQIPTTLLAMVDSSVGGKTGIDLEAGKNLVGAFWQPKLVLIDPETLKTLSERELKSGLAEVVKYGIIQDKDLFDYLIVNLEKILGIDLIFYSKIIAKCCKLKADVVINDEREKGVRAILNFGHTFGHAIEAVTHYKKYTHGEAVSVGMLMAAKIGSGLKHINIHQIEKLEKLINELGLLSKVTGVTSEEIYNAMFKDKKVKTGKINYVIPTEIGKVEIINIENEKLIKECISEFILN